MKRILFAAFFLMIAVLVDAQTKVNPVIKDYGTVNEVPFATEKPDPKLDYKIVLDISTEASKPESVNEGLDKVAKLVNLHVMGGVPLKKLHVSAVLHGAAAYVIMNNDSYRQMFGVDNPNLALLTALKQADVQLFVCGQSLFKRSINPNAIAPEVKVATSAITTITTHQLKGYATMQW